MQQVFLFGGIFGISDIEVFSSLFQTLAAVSAALIAYMGLNRGIETWKFQHTESAKIELVRKCLKAVFSLRDAIQDVRNPFIHISEIQKSLEEQNVEANPDKDREKVNRAVYSRRWQEVVKALNELQVLLVEVEVEWGAAAKSAIFEINEQVNELRFNIEMFLDYREDEIHDRDILYFSGKDDEFTEKLNSSVAAAEKYLKSKLTKVI